MPIDGFGGADQSLTELIQGKPIGYTPVFKFGRNTDVDSTVSESAPADIWDGGATVLVYPFPASAGALEIVSDNVNDTLLGTGARTVAVVWQDDSFVEFMATANMNGTTAVAVDPDGYRSYRAFVVMAGSTGVNEGTISITIGGTEVAKIMPSTGQTRMAIYTIPSVTHNGDTIADAKLYQCSGKVLRSGGTGKAEAQLRVRNNGGSWTSQDDLVLDPKDLIDYVDGRGYPVGADIRLTAVNASNNNLVVFGNFSMRLYHG